MFAIMKKGARAGEQVFGDGVLEVLPDGFGFLRSPEASYMAGPTTSTSRPRRSGASTCTPATWSRARSACPKDGERYFALSRSTASTARRPESKHKVMFENLTPLFPKEQFKLERDNLKGEENITSRIIDIIAPIGKGQRSAVSSAQERQDGDDAALRTRSSPTTPMCT